jgi:hypothetical protein
MIALARMRVVGFLRSGRVVAPLLIALVVLSVAYGGGRADAAEAYGVSALIMFPVLAWQTKLLLDAEPDVQRRLALTTLRSRRREAVAGVLAALAVALPVVLLAMVLPWLFGALNSAGAGRGLLLGLWAHLIMLPAALGLGAWSSRVIVGTPGRAVAVLGAGVVLAIVLGLRGSPVPWLAPPLMSITRRLTSGISVAELVALSCWALVWAAAALSGYGWLRRSRA